MLRKQLQMEGTEMPAVGNKEDDGEKFVVGEE